MPTCATHSWSETCRDVPRFKPLCDDGVASAILQPPRSSTVVAQARTLAPVDFTRSSNAFRKPEVKTMTSGANSSTISQKGASKVPGCLKGNVHPRR